MRPLRHAVLPFALLLLGACTLDPGAPIAVPAPDVLLGSTPTASSSATATSWSWGEELFDLRPRWVQGQPNQLVPEYSLDGRRLRLRVRQSHDPVRNVYELRLALTNKSDAVAWSPMQLTATIARGSVALLGADRLQSATAGTWDYGQFLGSDASLTPGETSEERVVALQLPASASLHIALDGVILSTKIRWARTAAALPNLARVATPAELAQGFMNGTFVVQYQGGVLASTELARLNATYGLVSQSYVSDGPAYIIFSTDTDSTSTRATEGRLRQDPAVAVVYAAPTRTPVRARAFALPGTTEAQPQDADVNFPGAWAAAEGRGTSPGRGVTIGYIDTGSDATRAELGSRVTLASADCLGTVPCAVGDYDPSYHGTSVGSLLGASSDLAGVVGAAYGAELVSIRTTYTPWSRWSALAYVMAHPTIQILNLSYAGPYFDPIEAASIQALTSSGVLVVAAAGNDEKQPGGVSVPFHCFVGLPSYPAAVPGVMAVGGYAGTGISPTNPYDCIGQHIAMIAPDVSPLTQGRGTSFAAPRVAGAAAVLLGLKPTLSASALRAALLTQHAIAVPNANDWGSASVGRLFMGYGSVTGTVTSPQLGALVGVGVSAPGQASPPFVAPTTTTAGPSGAFTLGGLEAGGVSLVLSNLPANCTDPSASVVVNAGQSARADIVVDCTVAGPNTGVWVGSYSFGAFKLDLTQAGSLISGNVTGAGGCVAFHSGSISGNTVTISYQYTVDPGTAGSACYPTSQRITGIISANGASMSGNGVTSYGGGPISWTFNVTKQ